MVTIIDLEKETAEFMDINKTAKYADKTRIDMYKDRKLIYNNKYIFKSGIFEEINWDSIYCDSQLVRLSSDQLLDLCFGYSELCQKELASPITIIDLKDKNAQTLPYGQVIEEFNIPICIININIDKIPIVNKRYLFITGYIKEIDTQNGGRV